MTHLLALAPNYWLGSSICGASLWQVSESAGRPSTGAAWSIPAKLAASQPSQHPSQEWRNSHPQTASYQLRKGRQTIPLLNVTLAVPKHCVHCRLSLFMLNKSWFSSCSRISPAQGVIGDSARAVRTHTESNVLQHKMHNTRVERPSMQVTTHNMQWKGLIV